MYSSETAVAVIQPCMRLWHEWCHHDETGSLGAEKVICEVHWPLFWWMVVGLPIHCSSTVAQSSRS